MNEYLIAQRALSPAELQALANEQMLLMRQARPTIEQALQMMNYRTPVHVDPGWADWFACGDQLH